MRIKSVNHSYINNEHCATYALHFCKSAEVTFCQTHHIRSLLFIAWQTAGNYETKSNIYNNLSINYPNDDYRGIIYAGGNSILLIDNTCFNEISGQVLLNCDASAKIFVSHCYINVTTTVVYGLNVFAKENTQMFDKYHICMLDIKCPTVGFRNHRASFINVMLITPFILLIGYK